MFEAATRVPVHREGRRPSFVFLAGKGGAGKTTLAAARAIQHAVEGRDVLCVSMDPAHSLADALSTATSKVVLSDLPRPIPLQRATAGRLRALHLDADRALDRWLAARRPALRSLVARGTHLPADDIDAFFDLSLPGVDQLLALVELAHVAVALDPDVVVIDTASTGHTQNTLAMPGALHRLAAVLEGMQRQGPDRSHQPIDGAEGVADEGGALVDELRREARALDELLTDPTRSTWSWVTLADRPSLAESKDGIAALGRAGIAVNDLIINRVSTNVDDVCPSCVGRAAAERPVLARLHRALVDVRVPARLGGADGFRTMQSVPLLDDEPRGEDALLAIARDQARPVARSRAPFPGPFAAPFAAPFPAHRVAAEPRQLVIVTGSGGAGKTSVASSIALAAAHADPGRRVVLASADPAHSLADIVDVALGDDERELPGTTLRARELDAPTAFARARLRYRTLAGAMVRDLFDLAPPGLDELLAIVSVTGKLPLPGALPTAARELVVLDMAPTGHALRLLHMPAVAIDWLYALHAILLKERGRMATQLACELLQHARRLEALAAVLQDPARTAVVAVTRLAGLPIDETTRLLAALDAARLPCTDVVLNGRAHGRCARCRYRADAEEHALRGFAPALSGRRVIDIPLAPAPPIGLKALASFATSWRTWAALVPV